MMRVILGLLAPLLVAPVATATAGVAGEKLGQVSFPVSCSPAAKTSLERGPTARATP